MAIKHIAKDYHEIDGVKIPVAYSVKKDSPIRSIIKTFSWRIIATATTFLISFIISRFSEKSVNESLEIATYIASIEFFAKLFLYYFHERLWTNIKWGKSWNKNQIIRAIKLRIIKRKRRKRTKNHQK